MVDGGCCRSCIFFNFFCAVVRCAGVLVSYVIYSGSGGKFYIGSTQDMPGRLGQHNSAAPIIGGAINTHKEVDWELVGYVHGFGPRGVMHALHFEAMWQHHPYYGTPTVSDAVRVARYLVGQNHLFGQCPLKLVSSV